MKRFIPTSIQKILLFCTVFLSSIVTQAATDENQVTTSDGSIFALLVTFIAILLIVIIVLAGAIRNVTSNKEIWLKKFPKTPIVIFLLGLATISPMEAFAGTGNAGQFVLPDSIYYLLLTTIVLLFLVVLFLGRTLQNLLNELNDHKVEEESFIAKFTANLTDAIPVEREGEVMTDHEYDGIRELDNVLPPWWVYLFYGTIIFSVIYIVNYHILGSGNVMAEEFQEEMELAEQMKAAYEEASPGAIIDENTAILLTDAIDLERGKTIFEANCAACHKNDGRGDIGPNLTDQYWIHGGGIKDIYRTIKYGVPEKNMIAWEKLIKPDDIERVSSYIASLQGSNPANAKAPQGELWIENENSEETEADTTVSDTTSQE